MKDKRIRKRGHGTMDRARGHYVPAKRGVVSPCGRQQGQMEGNQLGEFLRFFLFSPLCDFGQDLGQVIEQVSHLQVSSSTSLSQPLLALCSQSSSPALPPPLGSS